MPATLNPTNPRRAFTFRASDDTDFDDGERVQLIIGDLPSGVSARSPVLVDIDIVDNTVQGSWLEFDLAAGRLTPAVVGVGRSGRPLDYVRSQIDAPGDVDWFAVDLEFQQMYRFIVKGASGEGRTLEFPMVYGVYTPDGRFVSGTRAHRLFFHTLSSETAHVHYTPETSGRHWFAVSGSIGATGIYDVRVLTLADDMQPDNPNSRSALAPGGTVEGGSIFGATRTGSRPSCKPASPTRRRSRPSSLSGCGASRWSSLPPTAPRWTAVPAASTATSPISRPQQRPSTTSLWNQRSGRSPAPTP